MTRHLLLAVAGLVWSVAASAAEPVAPAAGAEQKPQPQATKDLSPTAEPRVDTSSSAQQPTAPAGDKRVGPVGSDRLQLDTTIVQGNRELPKVLYIVPWKKADIGELPSQPFNSLLDEALAPWWYRAAVDPTPPAPLACRRQAQSAAGRWMRCQRA